MTINKYQFGVGLLVYLLVYMGRPYERTFKNGAPKSAKIANGAKFGSRRTHSIAPPLRLVFAMCLVARLQLQPFS